MPVSLSVAGNCLTRHGPSLEGRASHCGQAARRLFANQLYVRTSAKQRAPGVQKGRATTAFERARAHLKWWSAKTSASELRVFSPPLRFAMFFQLFFGGRTLKTMPCAVA